MTVAIEIEGTGVEIEAGRCPSNLSWSCPQDIANAHAEKRGIPAFCSRESCDGRTEFVLYEEWLVRSALIEPIFVGTTLLWVPSRLWRISETIQEAS